MLEQEARSIRRHVLKSQIKALLLNVPPNDAMAGLAIASGEFLVEVASTEENLEELLEELDRTTRIIAATWGHEDEDDAASEPVTGVH